MAQANNDWYHLNGGKEWAEAYYQANKDAHKQQVTQWNKDHPDEVRAFQKKSRQKLRAENPIKVLLDRAKYRARAKGIPFDITPADIEKVTHCPIFGTELVYGGTRESHETNYHATASLDRIIPSLGYVAGNVIVVSYRANMLKNEASLEEMEALYTFYSSLLSKPHK